MHYISVHGVQTLRAQLAGIAPWPLLPGSDDPYAMSPLYMHVQGDGYLVQRAQEAILQGNPTAVNSNVMQHAAMMVVPLVPQPTRPPSPHPAPTEDSGSSLIQAQREEYQAAEDADRRRQQQQQVESSR